MAPEAPADVKERRRYGKFRIARPFLSDAKDLVRLLMSQCIIYRAETMEMLDAIEYWAECDGFDEIFIGAEIPTYTALFERDGTGAVRFKEWQRKTP